MKNIFAVLLLCPILSNAQMSKQDSLWLPFKVFIGKWSGDSEGQPGKGKYERSYEIVLNKKFIEVKNKSTYPPSQNNPKGEVHEGHGFISYDKSRKTFVLRQFHIEGFVNQYKIESILQTKRQSFLFLRVLRTFQRDFAQERLIRLSTTMSSLKHLNSLSQKRNSKCIRKQC
jgi:hypothetical protein